MSSLQSQTVETVINISETDKCHGPSKHYKYKILNYVWNCSCNRCCVLLKMARLQVRLPANAYCRINCLFWRREHTHSLTHTCSLYCNACLQEPAEYRLRLVNAELPHSANHRLSTVITGWACPSHCTTTSFHHLHFNTQCHRPLLCCLLCTIGLITYRKMIWHGFWH